MRKYMYWHHRMVYDILVYHIHLHTCVLTHHRGSVVKSVMLLANNIAMAKMPQAKNHLSVTSGIYTCTRNPFKC